MAQSHSTLTTATEELDYSTCSVDRVKAPGSEAVVGLLCSFEAGLVLCAGVVEPPELCLQAVDLALPVRRLHVSVCLIIALLVRWSS